MYVFPVTFAQKAFLKNCMFGSKSNGKVRYTYYIKDEIPLKWLPKMCILIKEQSWLICLIFINDDKVTQ